MQATDHVRVAAAGHVPHTFIQYGPMRTATTLQHAALCVIMFLLHPDEPDQVTCYSGRHRVPRPRTKYSVFKTHNSSAPKLFAGDNWLFVTARNASAAAYTPIVSPDSGDWRGTAAAMSRELGVPVVYAQVVDLLALRGYRYIADYASLVRLTLDETEQLLDYMRYWSSLRQCCGSQMSSDWRKELQGDTEHSPAHPFGTGSYPACETMDLDHLEGNLLRTRVVSRFSNASAGFVLKQLAYYHDPVLTGNYCRLSNRVIASDGARRFNMVVTRKDIGLSDGPASSFKKLKPIKKQTKNGLGLGR